MKDKPHRKFTCWGCNNIWIAPVEFGRETQNIAGETWPNCPRCNVKASMASPWITYDGKPWDFPWSFNHPTSNEEFNPPTSNPVIFPFHDKTKTMESIQSLIDQAAEKADELIESEARQMLIKYQKALNEFVMGMGTAFFTTSVNENTMDGDWLRQCMRFEDWWEEDWFDQLCEDLDSFNDMVNELDDQFKICGTPMRFTALGEKKTNW